MSAAFSIGGVDISESYAWSLHCSFNLNVLGLLLTTQEAVKLIGPTGGSIINMSSIAGRMPVQTTSVYSATKAAVDAITIALSQELGPRKIRVNSLNPGMVETEGLHAGGLAEGDFRKSLESQTPLGRIAQPEDIARAAVFFRIRRCRLGHRPNADPFGRPTAVSGRLTCVCEPGSQLAWPQASEIGR